MSNLDEVLHSAQQMVNEHRHAYPPVWHDDATRIIEQARAELAALRQERDELRAVVEAARGLLRAVDGFGPVGSVYEKRNELAAALERVKGTK